MGVEHQRDIEPEKQPSSVFWTNESGTLTAHRIARVEVDETPAGSECEEYIAVCGAHAWSWFSPAMGVDETYLGTKDEAIKSGATLCGRCF